MILENCHNCNTNLSIAWTDYKKAFDSVPHSWIKGVLKPSKCHLPYETFSQSMRMWKTTLVLNTGKNTLNAGDVNINSGIFQEVSLSPILSCVTLIPLSKPLNNTGYSYKIYDEIINHLFYMGDLKLFAKNDLKPQGLLNIAN